ncbi:FecCD family ABC transporter permease [Desulfonauticus submarinus]
MSECTPSYNKQFNRKKNLLFLWILFLFICIITFTLLGTYKLTIPEIINIFLGQENSLKRTILLNIRLPRIFSAVIGGCGLSLAGILIQGILKNPLASPSTLGITHGAAFGASLSVIIFGNKFLSTSTFAFLGAISGSIVILYLSRLKRLSSESIILAGVAISSLFSAATILIQYLADETQLASVVFWTFGDVARANWTEIMIMGILVTFSAIYSFAKSWELNALDCGEETAHTLGINIQRIKITLILISSLLAAIITSFLGIIAFVGLISPHLARKLTGNNFLLLLPCSCVIGAVLLLGADNIARNIFHLGNLPVGITTSFLGAPMFLYLLMRSSRWF